MRSYPAVHRSLYPDFLMMFVSPLPGACFLRKATGPCPGYPNPVESSFPSYRLSCPPGRPEPSTLALPAVSSSIVCQCLLLHGPLTSPRLPNGSSPFGPQLARCSFLSPPGFLLFIIIFCRWSCFFFLPEAVPFPIHLVIGFVSFPLIFKSFAFLGLSIRFHSFFDPHYASDPSAGHFLHRLSPVSFLFVLSGAIDNTSRTVPFFPLLTDLVGRRNTGFPWCHPKWQGLSFTLFTLERQLEVFWLLFSYSSSLLFLFRSSCLFFSFLTLTSFFFLRPVLFLTAEVPPLTVSPPFSDFCPPRYLFYDLGASETLLTSSSRRPYPAAVLQNPALGPDLTLFTRTSLADRQNPGVSPCLAIRPGVSTFF